MTSAATGRHLRHAARARLFDTLAKTLEAGLPADRALAAARDVVDNRRGAACVDECTRAVQRGASLTRVLARCHLVTGNDATLLEAGERAGALPRVLAALASRYERLHRHGQRLRARLALPLAVLAIAVLTRSLPALASRRMSLGEYLLQTFATALAVGLALMLAAHLLRALTRGAQPAGCDRWPLLGGWLAEEARVTLLERLQILLEAGVAAHEAVRICARSAGGGLARHWLHRLGGRLSAGDSLAAALVSSGLVREGAEQALLATGEAAGRSEAMLARLVVAARERLDDRVASVAEWAPRVFYALLVAALAGNMLIG